MYLILIFILERKFFRFKYWITSFFLIGLTLMIISSERSISSTSLQKDHGYTYRFWITFLKPL